MKSVWRIPQKIKNRGASLVVQWLRVRLPLQGARVRAQVREDPTCRGAAGPVSHGWAREPRPLSLRVRSLCSATAEATTVRGPRTAKKNTHTQKNLKTERTRNWTQNQERVASQNPREFKGGKSL